MISLGRLPLKSCLFFLAATLSFCLCLTLTIGAGRTDFCFIWAMPASNTHQNWLYAGIGDYRFWVEVDEHAKNPSYRGPWDPYAPVPCGFVSDDFEVEMREAMPDPTLIRTEKWHITGRLWPLVVGSAVLPALASVMILKRGMPKRVSRPEAQSVSR